MQVKVGVFSTSFLLQPQPVCASEGFCIGGWREAKCPVPHPAAVVQRGDESRRCQPVRLFLVSDSGSIFVN